MKSFKQYISEAKAATKVFIQHLDKLPALKFLEVAKKLDKEFGGVLSKEQLDITEKIDGSALRFGLDEKGTFFMQSSTSPRYSEVGDFRQRSLDKGYTPEVGDHFDDIMRMVKTDKKVASILKKYQTENGIIIIGEILYPPFGVKDFDKIKFIRISYDQKNLGSDYTFVPFNVLDLEHNTHPKEGEIKQAFYDISTSVRKYLKPSIKIDSDIDIRTELGYVENDILNKYNDLDTILRSRKHADKELKLKIRGEVEELQKVLAKKILSYVKSGSLGPDFEGIVFKLSDGSIFKLITDKFNKADKPYT